MEITREEIGTLNELIKVKLQPEDYSDQYDAELKKYQKSVNMPGFRPGHVPKGLIRKKFGRSILLEEINKIVSGKLQDYITEQKLDILGSPIPSRNGSEDNNWEQPEDFEFSFEIGLAPEFELTLPPKKTFEYLEIEVDDERVKTYMDDIRRRFGNFTNPETADERSILYGDFTELDKNGEPLEGGITAKSALAIDLVKDKGVLKRLIGIKKGEKAVMDIRKATDNNVSEVSHLLNIPKEKAETLDSEFEFAIDTINQVDMAELDQDLFDKVYGEGNVKSEDEMRDRIREEIAGMFERESDKKLKHDLDHYFMDELRISLPDEFLKKWLHTTVENPLTEEQIEKDYPNYAKGMKLRLVENKIFRDQDLKIEEDEIRSKARQYILSQFQGYGSSLTEDIMSSLVARYLEKRESVDRIIETLSEEKVFNYLKSVVKTKNKKVSYDAFVKEVQEHHKHHH
jgi:trigger factor